MDARDRLAYYKRKILDGHPLTAEEQADYATIVRERGEASAPPMPSGGQAEADSKALVEEQIDTEG